MRFTLATTVLIALFVIFSVFDVNVANLVNVEDSAVPAANGNSNNGWVKDKQQLADNFVMGDKASHLMWFLQVRTNIEHSRPIRIQWIYLTHYICRSPICISASTLMKAVNVICANSSRARWTLSGQRPSLRPAI